MEPLLGAATVKLDFASLLKKAIYPKGKEFTSYWRKLFPFTVEPFSKGRGGWGVGGGGGGGGGGRGGGGVAEKRTGIHKNRLPCRRGWEFHYENMPIQI